MGKGQAGAVRPLKDKLCGFAPNIKVKIFMSYMCLTVHSNIIHWSAMCFRSTPFRKKVRGLSGGEGFEVNHPVGG